jgi:hypothetical protein
MYGVENAAIHVDRAARSMLMTDFSDRSMWMTEFSDRSMWMTEFSDRSMLMTDFSDRSMWMTEFSFSLHVSVPRHLWLFLTVSIFFSPDFKIFLKNAVNVIPIERDPIDFF